MRIPDRIKNLATIAARNSADRATVKLGGPYLRSRGDGGMPYRVVVAVHYNPFPNTSSGYNQSSEFNVRTYAGARRTVKAVTAALLGAGVNPEGITVTDSPYGA